MNDIRVLDCTLRDGGYCNEWRFGLENAKSIVKGLLDSGIEIVECGFLTEYVKHTPELTKFNMPDEVIQLLPECGSEVSFVVMMNYGEYNVEKLPICNGQGITGIRLAFHKKDCADALSVGRKIMEKGYALFLQPMVTLSYSDTEFLQLITNCNELEPYAFYIVDSFGTMTKNDLVRFYYLIEHNLKRKIAVGFHSHNNMQLAYANAQTLTELHSKHDIIIDSSIYGMGRGAGNLNTELFVWYLNDAFGKKYSVRPLLTVIDRVLDLFYKAYHWGYSLQNYLSAAHNTHPNYAVYLSDKNALNVEDIDAIFDGMEAEKRIYFDRQYAESIYLSYLSTRKVQGQHKEELEKIVSGKTVLLIAPGKSSYEEKELIQEFSTKSKVVTVSINHKYPYADTNYVFLSNLRRFRQMSGDALDKCIVTSNIMFEQAYLKTEYELLLNGNESVRDNAGLMAVKFFTMAGAQRLVLAGFDGYAHDSEENYADEKMLLYTYKTTADAMNAGMEEVLKEYRKSIDIIFLTEQRYVKL